MNKADGAERAPQPMVVIGHSHTETVTAAARESGVALDVLNFWHLPDPFVVEAGRMMLAPAIRERLTAPVFSLIGGAVHQDLGLVVHPRPFDFVWPERAELPLSPGADIIPYDALLAVMMERTRHYRDIMSAVRAAIAGPVFHLESPPTFEHEVLPQDDPGFYHLFGEDAAFSPAWLRYKLWRVHSGIIAAHCGTVGITFIPHPPEAVDARGFLLDAYHGTPAHANAAYGRLMLAQMREAANACDMQRDVAAAEAIPLVLGDDATPVPREGVEGWVDGCERGSVHGWAWQAGAPAEFAPAGDMEDASVGEAVVWPPLPWKFTGPYTGFVDAFGPDGINGWAQSVDAPSAPVKLELWEAGAPVASVTANAWRKDLEEGRQGDGRWGIAAAMPDGLRDGRLHRLHMRHSDGASAFDHELIVRMPPKPATPALPDQAEPAAAEDTKPRMVRPPRGDAQPAVMFSIVVNFYNMPREAARTLTSLSRGYQRDIDTLRYEVLCVDNHSDAPLEPHWIESFGPEFRLIRPSRKLPSPVAGINEAAAQARGKYIAIMIDGAHLLTPGVLREVWDAVAEAADAVVALRPWFVGGDQRWLAEAGYTRAQEDILFDKIGWPEDGYLLFREGAPFWESPRPWFDAMIESNCLFMPASLYRDIGGMAEAFSEAGAGYANLDLFRRAIEASPEPPVALIGEATFHQFHDGTTTNATREVKERRVRRYESRYVALRGQAYPVTNAVDIRLRGQIRNLHAVASWGRPAMPGRIGVTERVRPGSLILQFDETAQTYLNSVYVENRLHEETRWRGHRLGMAPTDLLAIEEIVARLRPGRIVTTNARHGLLVFLDDLLKLLDLPASRIIAVGDAPDSAGDSLPRTDAADSVAPDRVLRVQGEPRRSATIAAVDFALSAEETILVLFAPDAEDPMPFEALRAYADFVTPRSYLIFLGTTLGQPWLGYSKHWYLTSIRRLLDSEPFAIDHGCNPHLVSTSQFGYLQRIELPPHLHATLSSGAEMDHG